MLKRLPFFVFVLVACATPAAAQKVESVYTDLDSKKCKLIEQEHEGYSSTHECMGVAGYKLLVLYGDDRESVTVVRPDGSQHPLELWHTVSGMFSSVGQKAEWRVRRRAGKPEPFALIVRFNANKLADDPAQKISYLVVARVAPGKICVTDKIPPGADANELARRAADDSAAKPCLPSSGEGDAP